LSVPRISLFVVQVSTSWISVPDRSTAVVGFSTFDQSMPTVPPAVTSILRPVVVG